MRLATPDHRPQDPFAKSLENGSIAAFSLKSKVWLGKPSTMTSAFSSRA